MMNIDLSTYQISGLAMTSCLERDGTVFAATDHALLISSDGGQTWQDALQEVRAGQDVPVTCVLCTRSGNVLAGISGGILRSEDGNQWESALFGSPQPTISVMVETATGNLLAGTVQDGVFLSRDSGANWERWSFGLLDHNVYALLASPPGVSTAVFAGVETGIFTSTNNGRAWREVDFPMDDAPVLSLGALEDGSLFAGTEGGKLFRSTDQGKSWQAVGWGTFNDEISALASYAGSVYAASGDQLWVSTDGGENWQIWHAPQPVEGGYMCLAAGNGIVLAGTSGGQIFVIK
jgi:photosystem II stability/assembly factor-like uncharacterized protein